VVSFSGPQDPIADRSQDQVAANAEDQDRLDNDPFIAVATRSNVHAPIAFDWSVGHIHVKVFDEAEG